METGEDGVEDDGLELAEADTEMDTDNVGQSA